MKRKSKLFLSIASMMFAVALLCFGVYAALSVTYTISGSVVYEVKDVFVNIQTSVYVSTLGTLTDETQLRTNMTKLQNGEEVTNIADTGYTHSFETYKNGDITQHGDVTDEASGIKINYGSYKIENQGQENEYAQGFAYYIVVNIKNYGTEQVGVSVQNNINAQATNSKVAVTKSTNIDARGDSAFAEKNIVIALALDDATKSVSNVTFSLPIKISRTLVQEQTYGTISNSQGTYNIGSDDTVTFTSIVQDGSAMDMPGVSFYNFTLSDVPPNTKWLNLQTNGDFDVGYIAKSQYADVMDFVTNGIANVIGMICGNASTAIKVTDLVSGEDKTFTVMLCYMDNKPSKSSLTLGWSELKENMQTQDFEQIGTTYWGIGMLNMYYNQMLEMGASPLIDDPTEFINNFKNKTSVKIPSEITTIGAFAFDGCSNLQSIDLSACTNLTTIGYGAFYDCSSLQSVDLSACTNLTTIGEYAFYYCSSLKSVDLSGCTNLTTIEMYAFMDCSSLSEITIPQSVTTIGGSAFGGCSSLSEITIPQSVTTIGDDAFRFCSSLSEITIPQNVTTIGSYAFYNCSNLQSVDLRGCTNLTTIGDSAFSGCSSLSEITIPQSVTTIGDSAFSVCSSLVEVYNKSSLNITTTSYGLTALNVYSDTQGKSKLKYYNSNGAEVQDGDYIFYIDGNTKYFVKYKGQDTEITLPTISSIDSYEIYRYAFYENKKITSVIIPDSVTTIGYNAFDGCSSLTEITIPQSVTTIGEYAFCDCSNLQSVDLSGCTNLTTIAYNAFYDCSLTEITIPQNVTTISAYAFWDCSNLNTVVIDNLDIANAIADSRSQGYLLNNLKSGTGVVKVKCSGLDKVTSTYLTNTSNFTATYQDGYAVFTKK